MTIIDSNGRFFGKIHLLDLGVILFLLALGPLLVSAYQVLRESPKLVLRSVTPVQLQAGTQRRIKLLGSGFDRESTVQIGTLPAERTIFVNEARLDAILSPDLTSGWHPVFARNGRGRMSHLVRALEIIWSPKIEQVQLNVPKKGRAILEVKGNYFERGSTILLGDLRAVGVDYQGSSQMSGRFQAHDLKKGTYDVTVVNPNGLSAQLSDAIKVTEPLRSRVPALVYAAFRRLNTGQKDLLRKGLTHKDAFGQTNAEILKVLGVYPEGNNRWLVTAQMRLNVLPQIEQHGTHYILEGARVRAGSRIPIQMDGKSFEILVISSPTFLEVESPSLE